MHAKDLMVVFNLKKKPLFFVRIDDGDDEIGASFLCLFCECVKGGYRSYIRLLSGYSGEKSIVLRQNDPSKTIALSVRYFVEACGEGSVDHFYRSLSIEGRRWLVMAEHDELSKAAVECKGAQKRRRI